METLPDMAEEMNIGDYVDFEALQSLNEENPERLHNDPARFWDVMVKEEHRNSVARPTIPVEQGSSMFDVARKSDKRLSIMALAAAHR